MVDEINHLTPTLVKIVSPKRLATLLEVQKQTDFLGWYSHSLRRYFEAEDALLYQAFKLCRDGLAGEPNVLGVRQLLELFGEGVVNAVARQAQTIQAEGAEQVLALTGLSGRTTGGIFFFLLRQLYNQQLSQASATGSTSSGAQSLTPILSRLEEQAEVSEELADHNAGSAANAWAELKIPYLFPQDNTEIVGELFISNPTAVSRYQAAQRDVFSLIENMGKAMLDDSKTNRLWDEDSFTKAVERIFGTAIARKNKKH